MNEIYITSDQHLYHRNILKYQSNRNFNSVQEMNEQLIQRHNELVKKNNTIYMLGDLAFTGQDNIENVLKRLNGKIYYIYGNHDKQLKKDRFSQYFESRQNYLEVNIDGNNIVMFHYKISNWNRMHYGAYHFHGHSHDVTIPDCRRFDIGVDGNDCYPWNIRELIKMLEPFDQFDSHH